MSGSHGDGSGGTARGVCGNGGVHYGRNIGTEVTNKGASFYIVWKKLANDHRTGYG